MSKRSILLVFVLLCLSIVFVSAQDDVADEGWIVFAYPNADAESREIAIIRPDGSDLTFLTDNDWHDVSPVWSSDCSQIVFSSAETGNNEIYVMDADGSNVQILAERDGNDYPESWSPDSTQLIVRSHTDDAVNVFILDLETLEETELLDFYAKADWSPDGLKIAYDARGELTILNLETGQTRVRLNASSPVTAPTWSSDGQFIAYGANSINSNTGRSTNADIYTFNLETAEIQRITREPTPVRFPIWSPDGQWLLYTVYDAENKSPVLYIHNLEEGTAQPLLSDAEYTTFGGDWCVSPE